MQALLNKIQNTPLLVLGDLMMDHYIWGTVTRISPEAPVPIVQVQSESFVPGGAANVACNLQALGAQTYLCGILGEDKTAQNLLHLLQDRHIHCDSILYCPQLKSIRKSRILAGNQQLCRIDEEPAPSAYAQKSQDLQAILTPLFPKIKAIILSDYAKGTLTQPLLDFILKKARQYDIFVALDPHPKNPLKHTHLQLLKPNRAEALQLAEVPTSQQDTIQLEQIGERIFEKYQPENLILSLGSQGLMLGKRGHILKKVPTYAQEVFDVSGAGDTVISALTLAMVCGYSLEEAAHFANTAAGIVIRKIGTATPTPQEILNYVYTHEH